MAAITHLVFLDVETTAKYGPDSNKDAIIEVAAAKVELSTRRVLDRYETLVYPWGEQSKCYDPDGDTAEWDLGDYHKSSGHFKDVNWSTGPRYVDVLDVLSKRFLIDGATVAGQNPGFDLRHLKRDYEFCRMTCTPWMLTSCPWPKLDYHTIDLVPSALFLVMAGKIEGCSLKHAVKWAYGDPNYTQKHRAGADVDDSIRVFWAMYDYFTGGTRPAANWGDGNTFMANR